MNILIHVLVALLSMQGDSSNQASLIDQVHYQDSLIYVEMDQEFGITEGNAVKLNGKEISLQLSKVTDSRCPKGVNCIRAGEIEVDIIVTMENKAKKYTLRNPTWERGGTMEASLDDGLFLRLNGAFEEDKRLQGQDLQIAFVFSEVEKPIDTPKSH